MAESRDLPQIEEGGNQNIALGDQVGGGIQTDERENQNIARKKYFHLF